MQLLSHHMQLLCADLFCRVGGVKKGIPAVPAACQLLLAQRMQLSLCHTTCNITVTTTHMIVLHKLLLYVSFWQVCVN